MQRRMHLLDFTLSLMWILNTITIFLIDQAGSYVVDVVSLIYVKEEEEEEEKQWGSDNNKAYYLSEFFFLSLFFFKFLQETELTHTQTY